MFLLVIRDVVEVDPEMLDVMAMLSTLLACCMRPSPSGTAVTRLMKFPPGGFLAFLRLLGRCFIINLNVELFVG